MAVQTAPPLMIPGNLKRLFTVDEYYKMSEAGIIGPEDRVELIEGEIIAISPINAPHASVVKRLIRSFSVRLADRAIVDVQNPVRLSQRSEPQPDVVILKPRADFYAGAHPGPGEVLLVVEVADSTVDFDRDVKAPLYARYGLPEMWLVNLAEGQLEVYRQPGACGYADRRVLKRDAEIALLAFPDVIVPVSEILG